MPQLLNYQGRLTDDAGIPIITATTLRFSPYQGGDAATPGSGTLCYREDASAFAPVGHHHDPDYVNEGEADSVTSSMIVDGTIVDADINAGANIAGSMIDPTGLDADLLDGKDSLDFVHTTGDDMTGTLNIVTSSSPSLYAVTSNTIGKTVYGWASATSGTNYGVYGRTNSPSGYAGYFNGNAHVTGNFTVGGSKNCVQPIDNGRKVLLYAMESPEIWFEDFGSAQLVNGQAVVQLESVFTQAANTEIAYFVFPIPSGDCNGLYITQKDKDSFEVRELGDGTSSISFYYRIVAKRRGYEEVRFEEFTEPEQPPAEPNLPIEKK